MPWKSIRLELASTDDFPHGSASRSYLFRLPLGDGAMIDEEAIKRVPALATAHRYWPNERDRLGHIIRTARCWTVRFETGEESLLFGLECQPIEEDRIFVVDEPDGERRPFRIISVRPVT
jgi:hypothetical protein